MKRTLITFLALIPVSLCAQVRWLKPTHNFGAFSEDLGTVTTEFKAVNEGSEPVRIIDARATCGCTIPEFDKGDIAPGDTATLKVTYSAIGRPGKFDKKVYVKTSDNPSEQRTLTISGTVIGASATIRSRYPEDAGKMKLQSSTAGFGEVKRGKLKTVFINAYNQSADTLAPSLEGLPKYVDGQVTPAVIPPGEQASIALTVNSLKVPEYGINDADFLFRTDSEAEPFKMNLFAIIAEDFDALTPGQRMNAPVCNVEPAKLDLGQISSPQTVKFTVGNSGKSPLLIRRVQAVDPAITSAQISSTKIKAGGKATLTVTIDPAKAESDFINARISLITNDPDNSFAVVRLTAEL